MILPWLLTDEIIIIYYCVIKYYTTKWYGQLLLFLKGYVNKDDEDLNHIKKTKAITDGRSKTKTVNKNESSY